MTTKNDLIHDLILVTGAGGFIGGAIAADLRRQGYKRIRAVDIKPLDEWYQVFEDADNLVLDLNLKENCERASEGVTESVQLRSQYGRHGFYLEQQSLVHSVGADQYAHASGRAKIRRPEILLLLVGMRL
jgi:NAD(P)-dependent dehydrogenase (short-subunit alcohol dehydrogenase family)